MMRFILFNCHLTAKNLSGLATSCVGIDGVIDLSTISSFPFDSFTHK